MGTCLLHAKKERGSKLAQSKSQAGTKNKQADDTSKTGVVRAPLLTTVMQVASRFVLVWGVVDRFPNTTASDPVYSSMLFAWSMTEVIRYSYFACNLYFGDVPDVLLWLRSVIFMFPLRSSPPANPRIEMGLKKRRGSQKAILLMKGIIHRYNTFFVLYPLGISSECWLMYKAIDPAQSWNLAYGYVIKAILFIYIPGKWDEEAPRRLRC